MALWLQIYILPLPLSNQNYYLSYDNIFRRDFKMHMIKQNSNGRMYFDNYKNKNIDIKRTKDRIEYVYENQ